MACSSAAGRALFICTFFIGRCVNRGGIGARPRIFNLGVGTNGLTARLGGVVVTDTDGECLIVNGILGGGDGDGCDGGVVELLESSSTFPRTLIAVLIDTILPLSNCI